MPLLPVPNRRISKKQKDQLAKQAESRKKDLAGQQATKSTEPSDGGFSWAELLEKAGK